MDKQAAKARLALGLKKTLYGNEPSLAAHLLVGALGGGSLGSTVGWGLKDLVSSAAKKKSTGALVDPMEEALVSAITGTKRGGLVGATLGAGVGAKKYMSALRPYNKRKKAVNLALLGTTGGALGSLAQKGKEKTSSPVIFPTHLPTIRRLIKHHKAQSAKIANLKQMAKSNPDAAALLLAPGGSLLVPPYLRLKALVRQKAMSSGKMDQAIKELTTKTGRFKE